MSKQSEKVKRWRKNTKQKIIDSMGGKCNICNYNKCQDSLICHHLDPSKKDFALGKIRANPISWDKIVVELRKCVLLCHNCHAEVHENLTGIPENAKTFNENYAK